MSVKQQQKVETTTPTCSQSLVLVRNLIRIAISTIAYERKLFADEFFRDRVLSGVNIKSLSPSDENSSLLVSWLEEGVFDALEKKYVRNTFPFRGGRTPPDFFFSKLEKIIFNLFGQSDCTSPFEKYECISLCFNNLSIEKDDEFATINIQKDGFYPYPRAEIRNASLDLVSQLVELSEKLPPVPARCYCTLNLQYRQNTPEDYEPKGFGNVEPVEDMPYSHSAGLVVTEHHKLGLSIKLPVNLFEDMDSRQTPSSSFNSQSFSTPQQTNSPLSPPPEEEKGVKEKLRELNFRVLELIASGKKFIQLREMRETLEISDKFARELVKNLEAKKVLGAYNPKKRSVGRPVLINPESKKYLQNYGLSFPSEESVIKKKSGLEHHSNRTLAPSPSSRGEIAAHQAVTNPSPSKDEESGETDEQQWINQPLRLRKRKKVETSKAVQKKRRK